MKASNFQLRNRLQNFLHQFSCKSRSRCLLQKAREIQHLHQTAADSAVLPVTFTFDKHALHTHRAPHPPSLVTDTRQSRDSSTAVGQQQSTVPGAFLAGFPALHRRDTGWMYRIFVCGWFAWWHGWWGRPSSGFSTWSRPPLLLLFMGTSVRKKYFIEEYWK